MDYKKRNGLIIQQIKHFLVGVVDNNEEKRNMIKQIYELIKTSSATIFDLKDRMIKSGFMEEYEENQSNDLDVCFESIKQTCIKGISATMCEKDMFNVLDFDSLYNNLTGKDFKAMVASEHPDKIIDTVIDKIKSDNIKKSYDGVKWINLSELNNLYYTLTNNYLKDKLIMEHYDEIKEDVREKIESECFYTKLGERIFNVKAFNKIFNMCTGKSFDIKWIKESEEIIKRIIFEGIEAEICYGDISNKQVDLRTLDKYPALKKQNISIETKLKKDRNLRQELDSDQMYDLRYNKKLREYLKQFIDQCVEDQIENGLYEDSRLCIDSELEKWLKPYFEQCTEKVIHSKLSISFIKEIKAESYLDDYLKECAEKIMEKAMSEYYSLIPNGDYMSRW